MGNRASTQGIGRSSLGDAYHPWYDAGERHGDWIIRRASLDGLQEVMCWQRKVILLERDRTKWERRSDLAHAIAHIDLAHRTIGDKEEEAAVRYAAKRLIHRNDLGDALVQTGGSITVETSEILGVDHATLLARLTNMHPAEKAAIRRRLAAILEAQTA